MQPIARIVTFNDGKSVLLPFTRRSILGGLTHLIESSPAGTYGGWISGDTLEENHENILIEYIREKYKNLTLRDNPYYKKEIEFYGKTKFDSTQIIDLQSIADDVSIAQNRGHRSSLAKARRHGLKISVAKTKNEWDTYYKIYKQSLARWGDSASNCYEKKLFDIIHENARESENIHLWLAKSQNTVVAGALCLSCHNNVIYWHGAALEDYFHMRPVNILITTIIENSKYNNKKWFDFNPSGGHVGVENFKRGFGATKANCKITNNMSASVTTLRKIQKSIARKQKS